MVAVLALVIYVWIFATGMVDTPVRSDACSYYAYLPSWVICHDPSLEACSQSCCAGTFLSYSGLTRWEAPGAG